MRRDAVPPPKESEVEGIPASSSLSLPSSLTRPPNQLRRSFCFRHGDSRTREGCPAASTASPLAGTSRCSCGKRTHRGTTQQTSRPVSSLTRASFSVIWPLLSHSPWSLNVSQRKRREGGRVAKCTYSVMVDTSGRRQTGMSQRTETAMWAKRLIHSGMCLPVSLSTNSSAKWLQLRSRRWYFLPVYFKPMRATIRSISCRL